MSDEFKAMLWGLGIAIVFMAGLLVIVPFLLMFGKFMFGLCGLL